MEELVYLVALVELIALHYPQSRTRQESFFSQTRLHSLPRTRLQLHYSPCSLFWLYRGLHCKPATDVSRRAKVWLWPVVLSDTRPTPGFRVCLQSDRRTHQYLPPALTNRYRPKPSMSLSPADFPFCFVIVLMNVSCQGHENSCFDGMPFVGKSVCHCG